MKTVAYALSEAFTAKENCKKNNNNEWSQRWEDRTNQLCALLPSGSGIDCGTYFLRKFSTTEKLCFFVDFHHMDDNGSYDGWTQHVITVTPSFSGISLKVSGKDRNNIKDYLHEVYSHALDQEAPAYPWA